MTSKKLDLSYMRFVQIGQNCQLCEMITQKDYLILRYLPYMTGNLDRLSTISFMASSVTSRDVAWRIDCV